MKRFILSEIVLLSLNSSIKHTWLNQSIGLHMQGGIISIYLLKILHFFNINKIFFLVRYYGLI